MQCFKPVMSATNSPVDVAMQNSFVLGCSSLGVAQAVDTCKNSRLCSGPSVSLVNSSWEVAVQNSFVCMMPGDDCLDLRFGSVDINDFNIGDIKASDTCMASSLCSEQVVPHANSRMIGAVHNSLGSASMCDSDTGDVQPAALDVVLAASMDRSIHGLHNSVQCWSSDDLVNNSMINSNSIRLYVMLGRTESWLGACLHFGRIGLVMVNHGLAGAGNPYIG